MNQVTDKKKENKRNTKEKETKYKAKNFFKNLHYKPPKRGMLDLMNFQEAI